MAQKVPLTPGKPLPKGAARFTSEVVTVEGKRPKKPRGKALKPFQINGACLHCAVRDLMSDWVENDLCDITEAIGFVVSGVCDILAAAPADGRDALAKQIAAEIPLVVSRRGEKLDAGQPLTGHMH